jgi:hypothetical protein
VNPSRRRRPLIAKRARRAMIRRFFKERKKRKKGQDIQMPLPRNLVKGRVYLDYANSIEPMMYSSVWVELPQDKVASTLRNMQEKGFWSLRSQNGELIHIPPHKIMQVQLIVGD